MKYLQKLPWIVFGISIIITMLVWISFLNYENQLQESKFNSKTIEMTQSILDKLEQYEQVLIGAKGLFSASQEVTPEGWKSFVDIQLITRYQDIQGIAYLKHITSEEEADNLVTQMHNYGFDDFTIKPEGKRSEYYPVVYLEPLNFRNERAIGFDIYTEDKRRAAVNLAKETGQTTLSEKIILVQETDEDIQNGFLLMVPLYSSEKNSSAENDSSSLLGIVDVVFRINDFVDALLGKQTFEYINMRIYDGSVELENLFFDSNTFFEYEENRIDFSGTSNIEFANRNWILVFNGLSPPYTQINEIILISIPIVGVLMSASVFYAFTLFNKNLQLLKTNIQYQELKKTNKAKDEFSSMITHELKSPIFPILGYCKMLKKDGMIGNLNEEQLKAVETIERNATGLEKLILDILDAKKLEMKKLKFEIEEFSLDEFITDLKSSNKNIIEEKGIEFVINSSKIQGLVIKSDKTRLRQVFDNLINNSAKFVNKQGGKIEAGAIKEDWQILFYVRDNGIGIPKDKQKDLFKKFYQVDSSLERSEGSGLGLAICKAITEKLGGEIWVESQEGKGSTFYFTISSNKNKVIWSRQG